MVKRSLYEYKVQKMPIIYIAYKWQPGRVENHYNGHDLVQALPIYMLF